jgi:adenine-specific DNA-methyltransferase
MDKLKMKTANKADENFKKLAAMFPNAVTETIDDNGEVVRAIDKDVLMQEISCKVVEGNEERYQFTWPDKKKSVLLANAPIAKTLRPCREESVNFDTTENLYIEGDNLEVLKLLQETYLGKIKMIYIDPPYNTGNDFVYEDDFAQSADEYLANSGQFDEEGNRLFTNTESNGRLHTDWLNMIYPRLKLAKDLLTDDGVIFISMDDHEQENIKKLCDEIFGEANFLAQVVWERAYSPVNLKKHFSESHDYIICYAKNIDVCACNGLPRSAEANDRYSNPDNDPRGDWKSSDLSVGPRVESKVYEITTPSGRKVLPPSGYCWRLDKKTFEQYVKDNRIWFGSDGNNVPSIKRFITEVKQGMTPMTVWKYTEVGHSQDAAQKLKKLFDGKALFDYPKSVDLIKRCLQLYTDTDCFVMDFFSGSATTAHAVMQLNAEDGGHRKFIMVQLPEETDEKSEAYKAGYKNICEIGKERIRRAGAKIIHNSQCIMHNEECLMTGCQNYELCIKNSELDVGFRVLKCDTTNMKDVYYKPTEYQRSMFGTLADNIKEDRTPEDLLFQVMLDLGILLSSKIQCEVLRVESDVDSTLQTPHSKLKEYTYFNVADGFLIACFDENVTDEVITAIAKQKPYYFVMRDSSMASDSVATNFEQIFETYSPTTERRVL